MRAELADLEDRRRRNLDAYQAGAITLQDLAEQNAPLVARDAELREAMAHGVQVAGEVVGLGGLRQGAARRLVASLRGESVEAQLLFLRQLYDVVRIHRGSIVLVYTGGLLPECERPTGWRYRGYDSVPW